MNEERKKALELLKQFMQGQDVLFLPEHFAVLEKDTEEPTDDEIIDALDDLNNIHASLFWEMAHPTEELKEGPFRNIRSVLNRCRTKADATLEIVKRTKEQYRKNIHLANGFDKNWIPKLLKVLDEIIQEAEGKK